MSSTASAQIGLLCSEFFGIFLNVTSLRAINNTAVKNAAAHGYLNDNQLDEYNIECQGHNTRMGKKAYNHSRERDRAKTLQNINDLINKKCLENVDSDDDSGGGESNVHLDDNDTSDEEVELLRKKRKRDERDIHCKHNENHSTLKKKKLSSDDQLQAKYVGDWGKKHPFYGSNALKIKWSPFEKDYIKDMVDKYPASKTHVWRH
jgi:hypothetical protein